MNNVSLVGRLTRDPEIKATNSGSSYARFSIAVDRRGKDAGTDFINIVAWRDRAEFIAKYFKKGKPILVLGELQTRSYTDKQGKKCYVTEVIVSEADFVENKNPSGEQKQISSGSDTYNPYIAAATAEQFEEVSDDSLPF